MRPMHGKRLLQRATMVSEVFQLFFGASSYYKSLAWGPAFEVHHEMIDRQDQELVAHSLALIGAFDRGGGLARIEEQHFGEFMHLRKL